MLSCFSRVQLFATLRNSMVYSPPGSSVHGILQARILAWVATPSSRGSSSPRDQTHICYVSCTCRQFFSNHPLPLSSLFKISPLLVASDSYFWLSLDFTKEFCFWDQLKIIRTDLLCILMKQDFLLLFFCFFFFFFSESSFYLMG